MTSTLSPPAPPEAPAPRPLSAQGAARPTRSAGLRPTAGELLDLGCLALLVVLGVYGFHTAYGGLRYFLVGIVGTVLGVVVAHVCARTRQPLLVVAAAIVTVFFVFGGAVAVPEDAWFGVLPSAASTTALIDGVVQGWARLLTTFTPVGSAANLLTVPYVCGLLAGLLSVTIAARTRRPAFAVVPPFGVLALAILFGTAQPASLLLQGAVFGAVSLGWVAARTRPNRPTGMVTRRSRRWIGRVVVLGVAAVAASQFGSSLPGAGSHNRFVLRERMEPPFDPYDHPSPLAGFRRYTDPGLLGEEVLFRVEGLRAGERIRLATMDAYDGVTYAVGAGAGSSGYFRRVGQEVPVEATGDVREVAVEVVGYEDVWLPTTGAVRSFTFDGARAEDLAEDLRVNLQTGTAVVASAIRPGDRYTMQAVETPPPSERDLRGGQPAEVPGPEVHPIAAVQELGADYAGDAPTAWERVHDIVAAVRRDGAFSDGHTEEGDHPSRPGHGAQRLSDMVDPNGMMVGNDEQYAPLVALMSQAVGVPARVVMGFEVPDRTGPDGAVVVRGGDVAAWIEVAIEGHGWVPVFDILPDEKEPRPLKDPEPRPQPVTPPPPPPPIPPSEEDETDPDKVQRERRRDRPDDRFAVPAFVYYLGGGLFSPVLVLGTFTSVVAAAKSRRRHRRRTRGRPTDRIAGGWLEVTDLATDLGSPVPERSTRREAALLVGVPAASTLARHADGIIFGPGEPGEQDVEAYWSEVEATRRAMVGDRTRFERWKVLVSLASLRRSGGRRTPRPGVVPRRGVAATGRSERRPAGRRSDR